MRIVLLRKGNAMPRFDIGGTLNILDEFGNIQGKIKGGNRIVSRLETEELIKMAKKAANGGKMDLEELGEFMAQVITLQDSRQAQYTSRNADYSWAN